MSSISGVGKIGPMHKEKQNKTLTLYTIKISTQSDNDSKSRTVTIKLLEEKHWGNTARYLHKQSLLDNTLETQTVKSK